MFHHRQFGAQCVIHKIKPQHEPEIAPRALRESAANPSPDAGACQEFAMV
jgi:hypothetical protein